MSSFKEISELAARMEREKDYSQAILLWKKAINISNKKNEIHWATCRFNFCSGRFCLPKEK